MKKILLALCFIFILTAPSFAADEKTAFAFTDNVVNEIMSNIIDSDMSRTAKIKRFRKVFEDDGDMTMVGKFVLGRFGKSVDQETMDKFVSAFTDAMVNSWIDRLMEYKGYTVSPYAMREAEGKGQLYVDTKVKSPHPDQNHPDATLIVRIKETDGKLRIVDLIIEGISMAMTYRDEYAPILQKSDGDVAALTKLIEAKTKQKADKS